MSETQAKVMAKLRALFDVIAAEADANPAFARKVEASLQSIFDRSAAEANAESIARRFAPTRRATVAAPWTQPPPPWAAPSSPSRAAAPETPSMLDGVTFDPLECHIEAAVLGGREQEARAFLGRLDRSQLEQVVKAQRLPGQRSLTQAIRDAEQASAVDAIVDSAAERVSRRFSAAG